MLQLINPVSDGFIASVLVEAGGGKRGIQNRRVVFFRNLSFQAVHDVRATALSLISGQHIHSRYMVRVEAACSDDLVAVCQHASVSGRDAFGNVRPAVVSAKEIYHFHRVIFWVNRFDRHVQNVVDRAVTFHTRVIACPLGTHLLHGCGKT